MTMRSFSLITLVVTLLGMFGWSGNASATEAFEPWESKDTCGEAAAAWCPQSEEHEFEVPNGVSEFVGYIEAADVNTTSVGIILQVSVNGKTYELRPAGLNQWKDRKEISFSVTPGTKWSIKINNLTTESYGSARVRIGGAYKAANTPTPTNTQVPPTATATATATQTRTTTPEVKCLSMRAEPETVRVNEPFSLIIEASNAVKFVFIHGDSRVERETNRMDGLVLNAPGSYNFNAAIVGADGKEYTSAACTAAIEVTTIVSTPPSGDEPPTATPTNTPAPECEENECPDFTPCSLAGFIQCLPNGKGIGFVLTNMMQPGVSPEAIDNGRFSVKSVTYFVNGWNLEDVYAAYEKNQITRDADLSWDEVFALFGSGSVDGAVIEIEELDDGNIQHFVIEQTVRKTDCEQPTADEPTMTPTPSASPTTGPTDVATPIPPCAVNCDGGAPASEASTPWWLWIVYIVGLVGAVWGIVLLVGLIRRITTRK